MRSVRELLLDQGESGSVLRCPQCGQTSTHIQEVFTRHGCDASEAEVYEGTDAHGVTGFRRSALVIVFMCEDECRFELVIQQHKGQNLVRLFPEHEGAFDDET